MDTRRPSLPKNALRLRSGTALIAATLIVLQGCAVHSRHAEPPAVTLPKQYRHATESVGAATETAWWKALGDPSLHTLVARATTDNLDIAAARARIAAARAAMGAAKSLSAPQFDAKGSISREKLSRNGLLGTFGGDMLPGAYTLSRAGLDASWELDLFGANAAERRKASARHSSALADLEAVRLSLSAEVAQVFIEHVVLSHRLASVREVVNTHEQSLRLVTQRFDQGDAAEADVKRAQLALQSAKVEEPRLQAEIDARRQAIGALLGSGEFVELPANSPLLGDNSMPAVANIAADIGLPSDLLRRRPDIVQADAEFIAAVADRDIAVADQYPRFALAAGGGLESIRQGSFLEAASRYWSIAPQLSLPIFDGGRRRAVAKQRKAELEAATALYRKAVIDALSDVEQALIRHRGAMNAMEASLNTLHKADGLLKIEETRYNHGDTALTEWLEAQRQYQQALQTVLGVKHDALLSYIALHKSLGGEFEGPDAVAKR